MYRKLRAAEGNDGTLSLVAAFGGLGWAFMVMVSATAFIAVPGGIKFGSMTPPAPDFVRMMDQVGFGALVVAGGLSAALFSAASSLIVMRHGGLPAWTAWLGFLATIALFFGALFLPVAVFLIWVLAVGIVMILSKGEPAVK